MLKARREWSRGELILALALYFSLPKGQDKITNPAIISLAKATKRSVKSIRARLQNFKTYDPAYTQMGHKGLSGGGTKCKEIAEEFYGHWSELAEEAAALREQYKLDNNFILKSKNLGLINQPITALDSFEQTVILGKDDFSIRKIRIGQTLFRQFLFAAYNGCCCMSEIALPALLRASHIKPWAVASAAEKVNPANGLLLNALYDAAFDQGYISVTPDYKILVSPQLLQADENSYAAFQQLAGRKIRLPARFSPAKQFLEYHNDCIFRR